MSRRKQANPKPIKVEVENIMTPIIKGEELEDEQDAANPSAMSLDNNDDIQDNQISLTNMKEEAMNILPETMPDILRSLSPSNSMSEESSSVVSQPMGKGTRIAPSKTRRKSDKILPVKDQTTGSDCFVCPVCKLGIKTSTEFTKHIRSHNTTSTINTCTICGKVLSSQSSLDRHMLVHSGERPFKCHVCGMAFTTNGNMHRHSRIHGKDGNTTSTSKEQQVVDNLKAHTVRSSGSRVVSASTKVVNAVDSITSPSVEVQCSTDMLQCPLCGETFASPYGLNTHYQEHDNDGDIECYMCNSRFISSFHVYIHYFVSHCTNQSLAKDILATVLPRSPETVVAPNGKLQQLGFDELIFMEFSSSTFPQVAKAWCEQNSRGASSETHKFECSKCNHAFPCPEALQLHTVNHPGESDFPCSKCPGMVFSDREAWEDHQALHHWAVKVMETYTKLEGGQDNDLQNVISKSEFMLMLGLKVSRSNVSVLQGEPDVAQQEVVKAKKRVSKSSETKPAEHTSSMYQCIICEFTFNNKVACELHCRQSHSLSSAQDISSSVCDMSLRLTQWHMLRCGLCAAGFSAVQNIQSHLEQQHKISSNNVLNWVLCNKAVENQSTLSDTTANTTGIVLSTPSCGPIMVKPESWPISTEEQPLDFSVKKSDYPVDLSIKATVNATPMFAPVGVYNSSKTTKLFDGILMKRGPNGIIPLSSAQVLMHHSGMAHNVTPPAPVTKSLYLCQYCTETFKKEDMLDSHVTKYHSQRMSLDKSAVELADQKPAITPSSTPTSVSSLTLPTVISNKRKWVSEEQGSTLKITPRPVSPQSSAGDVCLSENEGSNKKKRNSYSDSPHKLQCPRCSRAFPWISSLKRHMLTHTGQKPFKCPECTVTFSTKSNRERHMIRKHGLDIHSERVRQAMENPYSCEHCVCTFASATKMCTHYKDDHAGFDIPDFVTRQAHFESLPAMPLSNGKEAVQTMVNGELGSNASDEPQSDHASMDFEEYEDGEDYDENTVRSQPPPELTPVNIPQCVEADDDAPTLDCIKESGNPQRDNYNVDQITRCWRCDSTFSCRKHLLRHLKEHNIDHAFKCYLCDASFEGRKESLKHTLQTHPKHWKLLCEKNHCGNLETFTTQMDQRVHAFLESPGTDQSPGADEPVDSSILKESDYAQRKVFCTFCVKRFWSLQDLRRHMRSHTGERPFKCKVCHKRFTLKHSMTRHLKKHSLTQQAADASEEEEEDDDEDSGRLYIHEDESADLLHDLLGVEANKIDALLNATNGARNAADILGV